MKYFLTILAFLFSYGAQADITVRTVYSSTNVGTTSWVTLVSSLSSTIETISIFDSSGQTLELGIGATPVRLMLIPPGGGTFRQGISSGTQVSIRAVSALANTGESDINFFLK